MTIPAAPAREKHSILLAGREYRWSEVLPIGDDPRAWSHSGAAAGPDGSLYFGDSSGRLLYVVRPDGRGGIRDRRAVAVAATECHGLAVTADGDIWVADPGHKYTRDGAGYGDLRRGGGVTRFHPDGGIAQQLSSEGTRGWMPTSVALHDHGSASGGAVWVADGYGRSLVYGFDADGRCSFTANGADSGMPFRTPHAVIMDERSAEPRLLVADRGNRRIVQLSMDGRFLGAFGQAELTGPSAFAFDGELLLVTDLYGRIAAFGPDDSFLGGTGSLPHRRERPWPNEDRRRGIQAATRRAGRFHAPHGIAVGAEGEILVTEWGISGRVILLIPT
ncbi:hypothetical protein [Microbacterium sp. BK668]|uniref:hypothetical protein n=1 Tax=Microbacterium sp. BK668 TaxID=2512118 RepID=UPI00105E4E74|nr:hypothetical protein [Microbacterium sp. BK668]TDN91537.1 hypothetical protein EV279_1038 [Microbacterium sp. BK668]